MKEYTIKFNVGHKEHLFRIKTNLEDETPYTVEQAVISWTARTRNFRPESLCVYIMSKHDGSIIAEPVRNPKQ
jgi:hypothetical protein